MAGPTSTTPKLWLKADAGVYNDAGTTLATDGQSVQQWNDQSGNGNHATQGTSGNRPLYETNEINGLAVVRFDGSNDDIVSSYAAALGDFSCFVVFKRRGAGTEYSRLVDKNFGSGFWIGRDGSGVTNWYGSGILETSPPYGHFYSMDDDAVHCLGVVRSGTTKILCGDLGEVSETCVSTTTDTTAVRIGSSSGGSYWNGDICEVLVYDSALSSSERAELQSYLCNRWGVRTQKSRYVISCFNLADNSVGRLRILSSSDGLNFTLETSYYNFTSSSAGDYSLCRVGQTWLLAHTKTRDPSAKVTALGIASSSDCITFTPLADLDCTSVCGDTANSRAWAPEWLNDEGTLRLTFTASDNALSNLRQYYVTPSNFPPSSWGTIAELAGPGAGYIDGFVVPPSRSPGGNYNLFVKKQSGPQCIERWSSSTLGGTFTSVVTGDGYGFGEPREGPCLFRLPNGNWRMFMDEDTATTCLTYADSSDSWSTWSTPTALSSTFPFTPRHGTVFDNSGGLLFGSHSRLLHILTR